MVAGCKSDLGVFGVKRMKWFRTLSGSFAKRRVAMLIVTHVLRSTCTHSVLRLCTENSRYAALLPL